MSGPEINLYFKDPRLEMTHAGRFFVRSVFYSTYGLLLAATFTFLLSDISWVFWTGVLLLLILTDRAKHFGQAEWSLRGVKFRGDINLTRYITSVTFMLLEYAFERALLTDGNFYLFLLKRLVDRKDIQEGLIRMDLNPEEVANKVEEELQKSLEEKKFAGDKQERKKHLLVEIEKILKIAFEQALLADNRFIEPKDVFAALSYCESNAVLKILEFFNIDPGDLQNALIFSRYRENFGWLKNLPATIGGFVYRPYKIRHRVMNRSWSARPTPTLDRFSEDLTDYARLEKIGFLIGHEIEYDRLVDILSRPSRPNVLLIGDPGSGREALVNHLAYKITKDEVPSELFDKRLVMLRIGSLMAGAEQSELQTRITKIVEEIAQAGNIILYIPEIHNLLKTSGKTGVSAADIFLPAFASSAFSVVGSTYPKEYKQTVESQVDFSKAFEVIPVQEISVNDTIRLMVYESIILERQFHIKISFASIKQSVFLASRYFRDKLLPSSAQDLLKEALSDAKDKDDKILNADDVIDVAQKRVNIPLRQAKEAEAEKLLNLEELIHKRLVDQEQAVKAVSRSLREYRSGLSRKGGPIATFLFVGPTGVGKTELSKILAGIQFGSKEAMIRFDMSEYQDKQSIFRFIGSPDGNVSGNLTDAVLKNPYSLILLDEFEKAHPDILNLFLQVFDDGRLTDNTGRVADFQNTIIIATSNAHSNFIKSEIEAGKSMQEVSENLKKKLTELFRPELINRFSDIIVFKSLSREDTIAITRILLNDLIGDLKKNQGIELAIDEAGLNKIAEWGYDPVFGARPLRGVISDKLRSVLAEKILKKEVIRGSNITVKLEGGELNFHVI
ncbi:MAG: ATP-dependent Clp protease ATP-binding subunit [Candidatus Harrisonbacteria bacterium]|nr:ATP-dependent Clp protease ATP-binding subunit [Candidatus Harrisonbacteria bacterium]